MTCRATRAHRAGLPDRAAVEQELFGQRGLARVGVRDDGEGAAPVDLTLYNWVNDPALSAWFDTVMAAGLGPNNLQDGLSGFSGLIVSPEWEPPYVSAFSLGWGHAFNPNLVFDGNFVYRRGFNQMRQDSYAGNFSLGEFREAPWPASAPDPITGIATYPGFFGIMASDGKSEFFSLQFSLRGRAPKFDYGINLNFSDATGTQDNGATGVFTADGGVIEVSDAVLDGVNLAGAYMLLTRFAGADLSGTTGLTQEQIEIACGNGETKLPAGIKTPASWPCGGE